MIVYMITQEENAYDPQTWQESVWSDRAQAINRAKALFLTDKTNPMGLYGRRYNFYVYEMYVDASSEAEEIFNTEEMHSE